MNKELMELRKQPHLSASGLRSFIDCGLQFRFARIDNMVPAFKSSAMVLGTAIHSILEDYHRALIEGEILSEEDLVEVFELRLRSLCSGGHVPVRYKRGEEFDALLEQGKSMVRTWLDQCPQEESRVLAVEQVFSLDVPGVPVPVIGAIDLLLEDEQGTITVVDHKTSARRPGESDVEKSDQLTFYKMAVQAMGFADREVVLRLDYLLKTKTPQLAQFYTSRTQLDEARLTRKLKEAYQAIQAGCFLPNDGSWKCAGCGYQKACAEWSQPQAA